MKTEATLDPRMNAPHRYDWMKLVAAILTALIGFLFAAPMLWLLVASFNAHATLSSFNLGFSLQNFAKVFNMQTFGLPIVNSLIISIGTSVLVVTFSVLAAYPLSRFRSKTTNRTVNAILFASCLPITAMMVPVYGIFVQLHLIDSLTGTVLFMTACGLPQGIFMMKNFMDSVPVTLEEAAWVDGATRMQALFHVVVPLMVPSLLVIFISEFAGNWGNFFVPFMLLMSPDKEPAAVSIYTFFGQHGTVAYGQLAAFSLLYSLPILIIYEVTNRYIGNQTLLAGAVKE